jgi:hypothetical protein
MLRGVDVALARPLMTREKLCSDRTIAAERERAACRPRPQSSHTLTQPPARPGPQRRRENWCFARSRGARAMQSCRATPLARSRIFGLLFTLHNPEKFRSLVACPNLPSDFFPLRLASSWRPQLSSCASICTCNPMASNNVSATRCSGRWELKSRFEAPCTRPGADSFCAGLASLIQQMRILTSLKRRLCGFDFLLSRS